MTKQREKLIQFPKSLKSLSFCHHQSSKGMPSVSPFHVFLPRMSGAALLLFSLCLSFLPAILKTFQKERVISGVRRVVVFSWPHPLLDNMSSAAQLLLDSAVRDDDDPIFLYHHLNASLEAAKDAVNATSVKQILEAQTHYLFNDTIFGPSPAMESTPGRYFFEYRIH